LDLRIDLWSFGEPLTRGERVKKRIIKFIFLLFMILFFFPIKNCLGFFDDKSVGTTWANFLKIGVGAKAVGLGNAFVAIANDATTVYWNPAGLVQLPNHELIFIHNKWIQDVKYEYLGWGFPFNKKISLGLSLVYLHMGTIQGYDSNDQPTSEFTCYDAAILFGAGYRVSAKLSLGGTVKALQEKLEEQKKSAFALDLGALYHLNEKLSWGGTISNLGATVKFDQARYYLPFKITTGMAWHISPQFTFSTDFDFSYDQNTLWRKGIEYNYLNSLFLRVGSENRLTEGGLGSGFSFGAGLKFSNFEVNYTFSPGTDWGNTYKLSATYRFGHKK
jgi:hypothetical protein